MNELTFICDYIIFDDYKYKILKDNKAYLNAQIDFYSAIKSFIEAKSLYQSKILVTDKSGKEIINIFRHSILPLADKLFSIKIDQKVYTVREGKNLRVPDLYVRTELGKLNIYGKISSQDFIISNKDKTLASIKGSFKSKAKEYRLQFEDIYSNYENLFISLVLVLDSLYHDY